MTQRVSGDATILAMESPQEQLQTKTVSVEPTEITMGLGRRSANFFGYIVTFIVAYAVVANLIVAGDVIAYFVLEMENFPTSVFGIEKIIAFVVSTLLAWITGRYFHWSVFRKVTRPYAPHSPVLRITFFTFYSIFVLAFVLVITPSTLGLFYKDIQPIDDTDLQLPTLSIQDDQNALPDLMAASEALDRTYDTEKLRDILGGKTWDAAFAAQAIASNTAAINLYASAASKPIFQNPVTAEPDTLTPASVLPSLAIWRTLDRFNGLYAQYLARQGESSEAFQTALVGVNIGHKIETSQGHLIDWLTGRAIKVQALETIQMIIASSTTSSRELKSVAASLKMYSNDASGLVKTHKADYYSLKNLYQSIAYGDTNASTSSIPNGLQKLSAIDKTNFYYHPNETISNLATDIRGEINVSQSACDSIATHKPTRLSPSNLYFLFFTPNAIGKVLHDVVSARSDSTKRKQCQENALLSAVRLFAALKAYQQDNKRLPTSLDALVPIYLSDMPLDPFSGQKFRYNPTKKIIYSIGPDKQDVGGSTSGRWDQMSNPTFSIVF